MAHLLLWTLLLPCIQAADYNVVGLDNATFPLLVGRALPAFVRFDKDYAHGEKTDAFKALAASAVGAEVLIGSIGISTFGDKTNSDLAETFGYKQPGKDLVDKDMDELFPRFRFFPAHFTSTGVEYKGEVTQDAMTMFLKKEAKVYFGLQGTSKEFDKLASEYAKAAKDKRQEILTRAEEAAAAAKESDREAATYYVRIMQKSEATAGWFQHEFDRLKSMVDGGKVKGSKKDGMQLKINRLSSFVAPSDEL